MRPADPIAFVKILHAAFQARTGYSIRWNMHRERQWSEWCAWAEWEWTEADLARVIGYLRAEIAKGKRNEGALKFDNLIGNPPGFEEDLNLAKEAAKGNPTFRPKPSKPVPPPNKASDGHEIVSGKDAALDFLRSVQAPLP